MKRLKRFFGVLILTIFSLGACAQVEDSIYHQRLYYTCKAWGHLKYYHSSVAAGEHNWDDVLLNSLDGIKNAPDNQAFNDSLLVMLQQAGETQKGTNPLPVVPDSLNNNTDLSWIYHPIFSEPVSALLDTVMTRFRPCPNVYVDVVPGELVPDFANCDGQYHSTGLYPNENLRILAVFRYWNIIHYLFPYKHIMDQNWDTTLMQAIPMVINASNAIEYHLAMREFTAKINDSHSFLFSSIFDAWIGSSYSPFLARYIENKVVITKVLRTAPDIHPGDIITKIDGYDIDYLMDSLRKYSYGSNEILVETNLIDLILRGRSARFPLTVMNETGETTVELKRSSMNYNTLSFDKTPEWRDTIVNNCHIGIVNMGKLTTSHFPEIIEKFKSVDAIVFDIRNYPNGTLWSLVDYLFSSPIHVVNFTAPDFQYPGMFNWHEEIIGGYSGQPIEKEYRILFDERTQSQAEYTCMGLEQIPGAVKIGSTTAAADGNVAYIFLPGKIVALATLLGTYYPDYTPTQRVGIIPDYEIKPTIKGIREQKDEVLDFALTCIITSINDTAKNDELIVYPNPTSGKLTIKNNDLPIKEILIFDLLGRIVATGNGISPNHTIEMDISHLPGGFYLLSVNGKKTKLVKQ